ncbi:MAG: DUF3344 domain-containing protein [Methanobacterium sp.]|nr:DUF3344 domain-containing protein [Methanobacterium sp.]
MENISPKISKNHILLLTLTMVLTLIFCGAVSAADLSVTGDVDVVPTGKNTVFAKETNPVKATITNNGPDTANSILVGLYASDISIIDPVATTTIDSLAGSSSTNIEIIDPTIRSLAGGTVTYTIKVDPNNTIVETDETNNNKDSTVKNVKYNGYKGKQYWENGSDITTQRYYDIYGDVVFSSGDSTYHSGGWNDYTITWSGTQPTIPGTANIQEAWLYVPYNWDETGLVPNNLTLTFNGQVITYTNWYSDQSNFGTYANYKYGLLTYNVTSLYIKNGTNTLFIDRNGTSSIAMYPSSLMVIYQDASSTRKQIFINEETDLLGVSQTSYGTTTDEATAYAPFTGMSIDTTKIINGTIYSFAGSAGPNEGNLLWNGSVIASNAWQGTSTTASALIANVTSYLTTSNIAGIQATNSGGMAAYQQILVVEYAPDLVITEIKANKGTGDYMFANEPNIISITVSNQGGSASPESSLTVTINGADYPVTVPALSIGSSSTVTVTDPTSYTLGPTIQVNATCDPSNTIPETNETNNTMTTDLSIYNNGYKSKRYTGGSDLETQQTFDGKYDLIYSYGNTAYNGANWTAKTYNWTSTNLSIPAGATVVSARLYQGYTYNQKVSDPAWTMTFNGQLVNTINTYSDIKGFGSYNFPYGLYVYDVTSLFNIAGNSITITPEAGNNYGIYGAYIIVVYQDPNTSNKKIWINDGFDMLCSRETYSVNDAEATAYANFAGANTSSLSNAEVINILASAGDSGKSKFFFNGNQYTGFWNDYIGSPQIGFSTYDVTSTLQNGSNQAGMQSYDPTPGNTSSYGDNMYVMNSILITTYNTVTNTRTGNSYTSIQEAIDDVLTINGDTITVHDGIYNENITVNKQLTLNTVGSVTVNPINTDLPIITINSDGNGSVVQGFTLSGSTSSFGVNLNSASNVNLISNSIFGNFVGIYLQNSNTNTIAGNNIQSNGWVGICLDNSSNNTLNADNIITGNVEGVFIVNTSNSNLITGNNIHNNTDTGITILNNPTGNNITSNTAISNNGIIGVLIRNADGNTITSNNIQNNGWAGIALDNSDGNSINGTNNILGNLEGINLTNTSTSNTITGNNITGNTNIGISLINSSTGNLITSNTAISSNGIIGVYLRDSGTNTFSGNTIQSNGWVGVCLDQATGNTINGSNTISNNMEGLYLVNNSNNNLITNNNIQNNTDTGIYIENSLGNQITVNTNISSNGVLGILLRGANSNIITGNTLISNTWSGIAFDNANNNTIGTNIISSSQMGIYLTNNSSSNTINNISLQNNIWAGLVLDHAINTTCYNNNFINNPLQVLAQNGSNNTFYQGTSGNYWSDWNTADPRPIDGNENIFDQYPSTTQF